MRAILEIGFIVFLFYSNLFMGEFTRSSAGRTHGLLWALHDIVTLTTIITAIILGAVGYFVFEFFKRVI